MRQHELIAARLIGGLLRVRRWTRRHPVVAATTSLLAVALVVATVLLLQLFRQRQGLLAGSKCSRRCRRATRTQERWGVLAAAPWVPASKLDGPLIDLLTRDNLQLSLDPARLGAEPVGAPFFGADDRALFVPTAAGELLDDLTSRPATAANVDCCTRVL